MDRKEDCKSEDNEEKGDKLPSLLFFDTFSHESSEKSSLDVIQFSRPVLIERITIIPLGTKIEADFPGGVRLGATNPSSFALQFNVNDLSKPNSSTFAHCGSFEYKERINEVYTPSEKKVTDAVVIQGSYRTLTLAIFGDLVDLSSIVTQSETPSTTPVSEPSSYISSVKQEYDTEKEVDVSVKTFENDNERKRENDINFESLPSPSFADDFKCKNEPKASPDSVKSKESTPHQIDSSICVTNDKRFDDCDENKEQSTMRITHSRPKSPFNVYSRYKRSRSKSPATKKPNNRSRSPHSKRRTPSPNRQRRSPHSSNSSRSPKSVRSRSPRSIKSLSPSPKYGRHTSPSSRSQKSLQSVKSTSSTSHSPVTKIERINLRDKVHDNNVLDKPDSGVYELQNNPLPLDSDLLEPVSSEHSPVSAENVSDDGDIGDMDVEFNHEINDAQKDCDDFEAISSDEEYIDDNIIDESDVVVDYGDFPINDYSYIWTFNPFQCEFECLTYFGNPASGFFRRKPINCDNQKVFELLKLIESFKSETLKNERWIEAVETVASDIHLLNIDSEMMQSLVEWVVDGLDYELAMKQPLTGSKVRHIKAGIKLLISLFDTRGEVVETILSTEALRMLMDLYFKPYMSLPVKLLITRGFDAVCNSSVGVNHVINHRYQLENVRGGAEETCYQMLLNLMLSKPPSRLSAALVALLSKIHYFECFGLLKSMVFDNQLTDKINFTKLRSLLIEIISTFKKAKFCLTQRLRYLPASSQFQVNKVLSTIYPAVYNWMSYHDTLECILRIYHNSDLECLTEYCDEFVSELLNEENGPLFLLGKNAITKSNDIQRILVQDCDDTENQAQNIGFRFSFTLQANFLIDSLFEMQHKEHFDVSRACDDPEMAATFHRLYALVFNVAGRRAVIDALTAADNIKVLFPFLLPTGNKKIDIRISKSVCSGYAAELCLLVVQSTESEIVEFIENHGEQLLKISENDYIPKLSVLSSWMWPLKNGLTLAYNEQTFKSLVEVIKKFSESLKENGESNVFTIPLELITVMRILKQLCVNPSKDEKNDYGTSLELKFQYGIVQIYTLDTMAMLLNIMNKLLDTYLKPSHQSASLVGNQGSLIIQLVKPCLKLIKEMIHRLTIAQGKDFKDITPVYMFLRVYSLMAIFPSSSFHYSTAQELCSLIVEILMIYTQICLSSTETEEALTKSVWSKMLLEVFQYTFSSPLTFLHGLTLLSDLLPLPLPIHSPEALKHDEITKLINFRKLWSAHLHVLSSEIDTLINCFVFSASLCVQQLVRRICIQITDLSASSAVTVVKTILELFSEHYPTSEESTSNLYCVLNLLSSLMTHPPFKITFIQIIYGSKNEEKYGQTLNKLLALLKINIDKLVNIAVAELTMVSLDVFEISNNIILTLQSIIQSLCDPQISLCSTEPSGTNLQNLSNSIPPKEVLILISNSLLNLITKTIHRKSLPLITLSLRIMTLLCEHDFGFWNFKQTLVEKHPLAIHALIFNICAFWENDKSKYEYCKQTLESLCCFLKVLLNPDENESVRQVKLSTAEARKLMNWESNEELKCHPLRSIQNILQKTENFDETSSNSFEWLIELLEKNVTESTTKLLEPILPSADTLAFQFSGRPVYFVTHHCNERQHYFPASAEFFDYESSLIGEGTKINLKSLSEDYCGTDFDLKSALEELCKCQEPGELPLNASSDLPIKKSDSLTSHKDSMKHTAIKTPYIAPMRGRGYQRPGMMSHSTRVNDPFRSRPPNTSRPPSMHVDDFVALEQGRNDNFSGGKRSSKDYRGCSPNSRVYSIGTMPRPMYYAADVYANRRTHPLSPPPLHQPSRSARYVRDSYSPQGSRSRSDSLGPSTGQHWSKMGIAGSRRDSREARDSRQSRPFPR
ncbi:Protein virilizer-like protein [Leptotrombidium deliense]|uniref:Protein virilizer-like protein n=1 Tax=Leptotrombidium deliense TaxID=299467 RepID=A0A443SWC4_9ACAR|nr:Protein virilizer-like protein [Leptotrombidium deliense]